MCACMAIYYLIVPNLSSICLSISHHLVLYMLVNPAVLLLKQDTLMSFT